MKYIKKINDAIYDVINIGIKNLIKAGYHNTSAGISLVKSEFWVDIEGDHADELKEHDAPLGISFTVVSDDPDDIYTSIACELAMIDTFIEYTEALIPVKKIEQEAKMFRDIIQQLAEKSGIKINMNTNNDGTMHACIIVPAEQHISMNNRLELNEVGIYLPVSVSYKDYTKYEIDVRDEYDAKMKFISWLSKLPIARLDNDAH